jgi:hypothetical protein
LLESVKKKKRTGRGSSLLQGSNVSARSARLKPKGLGSKKGDGKRGKYGRRRKKPDGERWSVRGKRRKSDAVVRTLLDGQKKLQGAVRRRRNSG